MASETEEAVSQAQGLYPSRLIHDASHAESERERKAIVRAYLLGMAWPCLDGDNPEYEAHFEAHKRQTINAFLGTGTELES